MRQGSIIIGIMIIFISILIYIIKNIDMFYKIIEKKINKKIKYIFLFIILLCLIFFIYNNFIKIYDNIRIYIKQKSFNELYEYSDNKKREENAYYKEINEKYENENFKNPYIPEGFCYVEGTYVDGFVIEDKEKNQYVWVPCTNKELENIPTLKKRNFAFPAFVSKDMCYDEKYEKFLKSAFENGGFYISRFEIGEENGIPVSKPNVELVSDLTIDEAKKTVSNMYKNEKINCEIINGFAYDTTILWLQMNQEIDKQNIDVEEQKSIYTGRKSYNKIFDLFDNIMEFTTEIYYDNIIVRGVGTVIEETENEIGFDEESRYTILKNNNFVNLYDKLAIRTIIYK